MAAARRSSGRKAAPARKSAPRRVHRSKAVNIETTDGSLLSGTIADEFRKRIPDREIYALLYAKHPWVRSTVDMIAVEVGRGGFSFVKADDEDGAAVTADQDKRIPTLRSTFRHLFPGTTLNESLEALAKDLGTHGWGFWRRMRDGSRTLVGLERMDPRFVVPRLSDDGTEIIAFLQKRHDVAPEGIPVASNPTGADTIPVEDVVFFRRAGGDVVLGAPSPLEALDFATATDINIATFRNRFFRNGAVLGLILANEDGDEDDFRAAVKTIEQRKTGVTKVGSTMVLTGKWDVHQLTQSGKNDLDFVKGTGLSREDIGAVYHVPPSKILMSGNALGGSGKSQDDATFEEQAVLPLEELIFARITRDILEGDFGIDDLEMVPKRRSKVRLELFDAAAQLVKFGGTGNEARDLVNLPKSDVPGMDDPLFIGATGQSGVSSDEIDPEGGAPGSAGPNDSNAPAAPGASDGDIPDGGDLENAGGRKPSAKRKGWF